MYGATQRLNEDSMAKILNMESLNKGPTHSYAPPNPVAPTGIGGVIASHVSKVNHSTQAKGTVRRSNPYSPPPWENNKAVSRLTDMFADAVPTLGEIAQASMMMTTPNPFAIRYGQQAANTSFGNILMHVRAMNQQRDNQLSALLMDQQQHELIKQKFVYQQHKDALDIIRSQAETMKDSVGEAYRELMGILPKLDSAAANRLMQGIIDDPTPLESLESPSDVWRFMATKMADAGLKWKETKKGRKFSADVQPTDKIDRQSTVAGTFVLPDGRETKVATRTYEDGRTVTVDVLTGEIIPPEIMRHATIKEKESELSIFNRQLRDMQSGATSEPVSREVAEGVRQERATSRKASTTASTAASAVPEGAQKPEVTTGRPPPPWNDPDTKNKEEPAKKTLLPSKERREEASKRSTSAWDDLRTRTQEWWGDIFK